MERKHSHLYFTPIILFSLFFCSRMFVCIVVSLLLLLYFFSTFFSLTYPRLVFSSYYGPFPIVFMPYIAFDAPPPTDLVTTGRVFFTYL